MSEQQIIDIEATAIEEEWSPPEFLSIDAMLTEAGFEDIGTNASGKKPRKKPCKPLRKVESDGTPVPSKPKKKRRRYPPKLEKGMGKEEAKLARKAFDTTGNENYPWYPQGEETAQAYIYFKAYLDLGPMRTYKQIREILGLDAERLRLWAKRYNWDERVQAYNDHIVALEFINREKIIADKAAEDAEKWLTRQDEIRERAYNNANELIDAAMEMLRMPRTTQETYEDKVEIDTATGKQSIVRYTTIIMPTKFTLRDVSAFLKEGDRLQRMAAEMATSNQKITVEQQSTDITFEMLLDFVKSGKAIAEARQQMISVLLMDPVHVDAAIQRMQEGSQPMKQITGARVDE